MATVGDARKLIAEAISGTSIRPAGMPYPREVREMRDAAKALDTQLSTDAAAVGIEPHLIKHEAMLSPEAEVRFLQLSATHEAALAVIRV